MGWRPCLFILPINHASHTCTYLHGGEKGIDGQIAVGHNALRHEEDTGDGHEDGVAVVVVVVI